MWPMRKILLISIVLLSLVGLVHAQRTAPRTGKDVDGVTIYLGVIPAALLVGHPKGHTESEMHGGPPAGAHEYHVLVALYDSTTGTRIANAKVRVSAAPLGGTASERLLEPMLIADAITYGNYFTLTGEGTYVIRLRIDIPGRHTVQTMFEYQHGIS